MIWRFIPGFNDDYMMTKERHVKHLMSGNVLESMPINHNGELGYLMKNSDQFWRLILEHDLLCLTWPEFYKKGVEYAVFCANCKDTIYQSLENGRWYHKKGVTACKDDITHARPGRTVEL